MALENLMNQHMEHMEQRVLSVVIPLDILRIITKVAKYEYETIHCIALQFKKDLKVPPSTSW